MDNEINQEDRGLINEPMSPKMKMASTIGSIILVLAGLGLAYVTLADTEGTNKDIKEPKKRLLTESVPAYDLPKEDKPKASPVPKESDQKGLTQADLDRMLAEQQKRFDEMLAEQKRLAAAALANAQQKDKSHNHLNVGFGKTEDIKKEDPYLDRLLSAEMNDTKSGGGANLKNSSLRGGGESSGNRESLPYQNIDLSVTKTNLVQASVLPNLSFLIPKGIPIPCALNLAIQSDQSGILTCVTTEDIYSSDGTVILVDRGSNVTGEYRSQSISLGKNRIFAIWDRIRTPSGVVININSPAIGPLGRAGIGGYVDNHYLERFGSAILISLIDDAFAQNSNKNIDSTSDTTNDIASQMLQENQNIRPTLHTSQGSEVMIMVANDLDFSTVYGLTYAK
jgi:type IV secretory pathway VirB10-like protein